MSIILESDFSCASLVDLLEHRASRKPDHLVYRFLAENDELQSITYLQLAIRAQAIAAEIQESGVKPGERAILIYAPGLDLIAAYFGCFYAGVIAVLVYPPVNVKLVEKLQHIIENAQPSIILSSHDIAEKVNHLKLVKFSSHIPIIKKFIKEDLISMSKWDFGLYKWLQTDRVPDARSNEWRPQMIKPDDIAFLQYTSGSTGTPKGVIVSHNNLLHNLKLITRNFNNNKNSIGVIWLPPYHDMGLIGGILAPLFADFEINLMSPMRFLRNPYIWLKSISDYKATVSGGPNFAYEYCIKKISEEQKQTLDLRSWEVAFNGAEPIHPETLKRFYKSFKQCGFRREAFHPCYGMAESSLLATGGEYLKKYRKKYISAKSMKQHQLRIVDKEHPDAHPVVSSGRLEQKIVIVDPVTHKKCQDHEIGEIWIRGPSVTLGYWRRPEETNHTFKAKLEKKKDSPHHYLRTDDLGFIIDEHLYVTGRIKDLIIIHGCNYYPHDVEYYVNHCHALIRTGQSAAFSISVDNEECLAIACEINVNLTKEQHAEIFSAIEQTVAKHIGIAVHSITLLPPKSLPKTTSGKIRRQPCRQALADKSLIPIATWTLSHHIQTTGTHNEIFPEEEVHKHTKMNKNVINNYIKQFIANMINIPASEIKNTDLPCAIGLDSLKTMELFSHLQSQFEFNFPNELISNDTTVEMIAHEFYQYIKHHPQFNDIIFTKLYNPIVDNIIKQAKVFSETELKNMNQLENYPEFIDFNTTLSTLKQKVNSDLFFNVIEDTSKDTITIKNEIYINFAGYNYLGLSGDPEVVEASCNAIKQYGTSVSASRIVSGQKPIHVDLENAIAHMIETDDSIVYTAGYGTNIGVITALYGKEDLIIHDELSHNSLVQGAVFSGAKRLTFPHNDYQALERLLKLHRHSYKKALIITEGVFSMDGDIPNVPKLIDIKNRYHSFLMIDEAHSIGVLGEHGRGIREYFNLPPKSVEIWMGTLSKSFASCGGYIAGSKPLIDFLKYRSNGFIFSAGITPANTAAALTAIEIMNKSPTRVADLQERSKLFLDILKENNVNTGLSNGTPIIPVIVGRSDYAITLSENLRKHNIYVLPIIYPAVADNAARIRFFINALHTTEQITYAAEITAKEYQALMKK